MPANLKITVIKKLSWKEMGFDKQHPEVQDFVDAYCGLWEEGREFIVGEDGKMPADFCTWAWADIWPEICTLRFGGNFPWIKKEGLIYASCTDAVRPVLFKIERM